MEVCQAPEPQTFESGKVESADRFGDVSESVGTGVAVLGSIGQGADAHGIQHHQEDSFDVGHTDSLVFFIFEVKGMFKEPEKML